MHRSNLVLVSSLAMYATEFGAYIQKRSPSTEPRLTADSIQQFQLVDSRSGSLLLAPLERLLELLLYPSQLLGGEKRILPTSRFSRTTAAAAAILPR